MVEPEAEAEQTPPPRNPAATVDYERPCELPDCPGIVEAGSTSATKFCPPHRGRDPKARKARRDWLREHGPKDATPINIQVGGGKGKGKNDTRGDAQPGELDAVHARGLQIAQITAALVLMGTKGQHREADALDIARGAEGWATSLRELAVYEPWVRKIAAGGEASERATAWVGFLVASAAIASPILVRHEIIKGGMANLADTILTNATAPNTTEHTDTDAAA